MTFQVFPPEINSLLMFSGAGSGPMLAAGSGVGGDGSSGGAVFGMVECGGGLGVGGGHAGQSRGK